MDIISVKNITITAKGQIALPKELRKIKGYTQGEKLAIITYPDRVELRPMKQFSEKLASALASEQSLAKDWLSDADKKAWKHL